MWSRSLSRRDAGTRSSKLSSGLSSTGVMAPVVRFSIDTVSWAPAVPGAPRTVVKPSVPGMAAVTVPAGGGGGAVVLSDVKATVASAAIGRPDGSLMSLATVNV